MKAGPGRPPKPKGLDAVRVEISRGLPAAIAAVLARVALGEPSDKATVDFLKTAIETLVFLDVEPAAAVAASPNTSPHPWVRGPTLVTPSKETSHDHQDPLPR